jgi:molybdopterin-guanine dinucleotide biosynthesis protein A
MDKIFAVLLAGGASERMGFNKLLLPINGKSALER